MCGSEVAGVKLSGAKLCGSVVAGHRMKDSVPSKSKCPFQAITGLNVEMKQPSSNAHNQISVVSPYLVCMLSLMPLDAFFHEEKERNHGEALVCNYDRT